MKKLISIIVTIGILVSNSCSLRNKVNAEEVLLGDVNLNERVDNADLVYLNSFLLRGTAYSEPIDCKIEIVSYLGMSEQQLRDYYYKEYKQRTEDPTHAWYKYSFLGSDNFDNSMRKYATYSSYYKKGDGFGRYAYHVYKASFKLYKVHSVYFYKLERGSGDINFDDNVDVADLALLKQYIMGDNIEKVNQKIERVIK